MYGELIGAGLSLLGGGGDNGASKEARDMKELLAKLDTPEFAKYAAEDYGYSGDYRPEESLYKTVSEDPRLKNAQMSALNRMSGLTEDGLSAGDENAFARARNQAGSMIRQGNAASMQNAEARGVAGSGMEFAMRQQAAQDAAQNAQSAGLQQADTSARQRMLANTAFGEQAGNIRSQDLMSTAKNSDIINQFNQANTGTRNSAQQFNLGNRQGVMNQNTAGRNDAFKYNQQMQQQAFANEAAKAKMQSEQSKMNMESANAGSAAQAGKTNQMAGMAGSAMKMFGM